MIRACRIPLGNASKTWPKEGEIDLNGTTLKKGDEGFYYDWFAEIHPLMGKEGFDAGLYMVRPSFEDALESMIKDEEMGFKVGFKAVVQQKTGSSKDPTPGLQVARQSGKKPSASGEFSDCMIFNFQKCIQSFCATSFTWKISLRATARDCVDLYR